MVSILEVVLHEKDRQFLLASSRDARLRILLEKASSESSRQEGELNAVGLRIEGLIDTFNSPGEANQECSSDLSAQVERLETWLRSTFNAPTWTGVMFVESFWLEQTTTAVSRAALVASASYAARFAELMSAGYAWINFHAAGVLGGRLLISVELPPGGPSNAPRTSVQLSGPFAFAAQRTGWRIDDLVAVT